MAQQLDGNRHTRRPTGAFSFRPPFFYCYPNREFWEGNQMLSWCLSISALSKHLVSCDSFTADSVFFN